MKTTYLTLFFFHTEMQFRQVGSFLIVLHNFYFSVTLTKCFVFARRYIEITHDPLLFSVAQGII
jgi:hypothetical protein